VVSSFTGFFSNVISVKCKVLLSYEPSPLKELEESDNPVSITVTCSEVNINFMHVLQFYSKQGFVLCCT
jgi:hypothetical protein